MFCADVDLLCLCNFLQDVLDDQSIVSCCVSAMGREQGAFSQPQLRCKAKSAADCTHDGVISWWYVELMMLTSIFLLLGFKKTL